MYGLTQIVKRDDGTMLRLMQPRPGARRTPNSRNVPDDDASQMVQPELVMLDDGD